MITSNARLSVGLRACERGHLCLLMRHLDLLSPQHGQLPHVPEGLEQVVVQLSGGLHQVSVRLVLLRVQIQQLHHALHAALPL